MLEKKMLSPGLSILFVLCIWSIVRIDLKEQFQVFFHEILLGLQIFNSISIEIELGYSRLKNNPKLQQLHTCVDFQRCVCVGEGGLTNLGTQN